MKTQVIQTAKSHLDSIKSSPIPLPSSEASPKEQTPTIQSHSYHQAATLSEIEHHFPPTVLQSSVSGYEILIADEACLSAMFQHSWGFFAREIQAESYAVKVIRSTKIRILFVVKRRQS